MSITSDEVNYLIYRYLNESGFVHTAFSFANESLVTKSPVAQLDVPPGALITFLQKGLEYVGIEEHITADGTIEEYDDDFTLLSPFVCQAIAKKEVRVLPAKTVPIIPYPADEADTSGPQKMEEDTAEGSRPGQTRENGTSAESTMGSGVYQLEGHQSEVHYCDWNPHHHVLATGSKDATCRIWQLEELASRPPDSTQPIEFESVVLPHNTSQIAGRVQDVTSLAWSPDGTCLVTGCYDGVITGWSRDGQQLWQMHAHGGPVFALKWTPNGQMIVSGSWDGKTIVMSGVTGKRLREFAADNKPVLDASWRDNDVFASAGGNRNICVWSIKGRTIEELQQEGATELSYSADEVEEVATTIDKPVQVWSGHTEEVNAICWSPDKRVLASCADDRTAKVWRLGTDACILDLRGHASEIYTCCWSATGPGSRNPDLPLRLITASFDSTVRLWDLDTQSCVFTLAKDGQPVYGIAASPNGLYVASGSLGGHLNVWSIEHGTLVKEFRGEGDIYDVAFSRDGQFLSACFSTGRVMLVDMRV